MEFAPALVPSLRSEELRRSVVNRDPKLRARLHNLHQQISKTRPGNNRTFGVQIINGRGQSGGHSASERTDKFDTIRRIRRGNTKRRVDEFEAL